MTRAIAPEAALAKKAPRKPAAPIRKGADRRPDGPCERPARAQDADGAIERVKAGVGEISLGERNRLGEGGGPNRDRDRGDDEQGDEICREPKQRIADGGAGERQEKRRHARPLVDPGAKRRAECDAAERPCGQDRAQRKGAQARLIDEKEHDVRAGDRIGEANEDVDDDKPDEEGRAGGVGGQRSLVGATKDAEGFSIGSKSSG